MVALGFAGFTVGQFPTTTLTRSNAYTSPKTDSPELTRTTTEYRRQEPPSSTCTSITTKRTDTRDLETALATHIVCGSDTATPTCSTSYECGCHSAHYTRTDHPDTHLCFPTTISYPDYGGGRTQPGRGVVRQAKVTHAPSKRRSEVHPVAARPTSQDFGGRRSQRRVAREAEATPVGPCLPGFRGPHCPTYPTINPKPPRDVQVRQAELTTCPPGSFGPDCLPRLTITPDSDVEARQLRWPKPRCPPGKFDPKCLLLPIPEVHAASDVEVRQLAPPPPPHWCAPGSFDPKCPPSPWPPADAIITPAAALEVPGEANKASSTIYTSTYTGTRIIQCPPGVCGPGCRWGHECNKLFGRVAREAEATAGPEVVHTTLLTVRA